MGIFKAQSGEEVYRLLALSNEGINTITGRGKDVDFTRKVASNILDVFKLEAGSVGCWLWRWNVIASMPKKWV